MQKFGGRMEKICGIYCIYNKINHKRYIGQSTNIYMRRCCHLSELRGNYHCNNHLQNAYNKYGEENFEFFIVELCDDKKLNDYEKFWIDYYNTFNMDYGYNRTTGGDGASGIKKTDEQRAVISEKLRGRPVSEQTREKFRKHILLQFQDKEFIKAFRKNIDSQKTPLDCYDKDGYICSYESVHEAAFDLGLIATNICKVLKHKYKTNGKYTFCYSNETLDKDELYRRFMQKECTDSHTYKQNYLVEVDENENIIRRFKSIQEAANFYNMDNSSISKVCRGKLKQTKGHIFRYID